MSNWIFHLAVWVFANFRHPFLALWWLGIVGSFAGGDRRTKLRLPLISSGIPLGAGMRDETISSRAEGKASRRQVGLRAMQVARQGRSRPLPAGAL